MRDCLGFGEERLRGGIVEGRKSWREEFLILLRGY